MFLDPRILNELRSYFAEVQILKGLRLKWHLAAGRPTLEGVVDNEVDKKITGIRANGVADVFSVANNLQISQYLQ